LQWLPLTEIQSEVQKISIMYWLSFLWINNLKLAKFRNSSLPFKIFILLLSCCILDSARRGCHPPPFPSTDLPLPCMAVNIHIDEGTYTV
jgi:hypothetical protein